jgi:hypothetical protein
VIGLSLWSCGSLEKTALQNESDLLVGNTANTKNTAQGVFGSFHEIHYLPQIPDNMRLSEYRKLVRQMSAEEYKRTGQRPQWEQWLQDLWEKHLFVTFTSWQEPHKAVVSFIDKTKGNFALVVEHQMLAAAMLQNCLFFQEPTPEVQRAVEYYLNVLEYYHNYQEVYIYSKALPTLYGYWPDEKISNTAATIISKTAKRNWLTSNEWSPSVEKFFRAKLPEQATLTKGGAQQNAKAKEVKEKFWREDIMKFPKYRHTRDITQDHLGFLPETFTTLYFIAEGKTRQ